MPDPARRLFALVDLLQSRGRATTPELARHLGVSERTLRRDLGRLRELDIPVEVNPGRAGGVSLPPGSLLPPLRFTDDELLALVLGVNLVSQTGDATLERASSRAVRRLQVLTEGTRTRLEALDHALALGPPGVSSSNVASLTVLELAEAVHQRRTLELRYASRGQASLRRVDPYGLARLYGRWYLVGYCHLRRDLRTFRLDRIRSFVGGAESFVRPEGLDAFDEIARSVALAQRPVRCQVRLFVSMERASRLLPGTDALLEPDPQGVLLTVRAHADYLEHVALELLGMFCKLEILEPPELKKAFVALGERATASGRADYL